MESALDDNVDRLVAALLVQATAQWATTLAVHLGTENAFSIARQAVEIAYAEMVDEVKRLHGPMNRDVQT